MARRTLMVTFVAAAGSRMGFGHLVRAGSLADALKVERRLVLRGTSSAKRAARRLGWQVFRSLTAASRDERPSLVVIDEPSRRHARRAVRWARTRQVPSLAVRDLGVTTGNADLVVDGSIVRVRGAVAANLQGPGFAILPSRIAALRRLSPRRASRRVVIALGGGAHVRRIGVSIARRLRAVAPDLAIELAAGFSRRRRSPRLGPRTRWIAPGKLSLALATASVAVVAGGVTLYEACALGTPIVTVPVVAAQRMTTRAFAAAGASIDAAAQRDVVVANRAAAAVLKLFGEPGVATRMASVSRRLVDGQGANRVAAEARRLVDDIALEERRHAA